MESSRRTFLGTAALGAGGLVMLTGSTSADAVKQDAGNPGDGGFGRQVSQLPSGRAVAYHDPKDVGEMPEFARSLDGSTPKVTSGGWAKEFDRAPTADYEGPRGRPYVSEPRCFA